MKPLQNGTVKSLLFSLLSAVLLTGCAVYEPAYPTYPTYPPATTYYDNYPAENGGMYVPPPAYAVPPPAAYAAPPVYMPPLFFNFGFWGRHGHHHGGHGGHGGHRGFHGGGGWRGHR
jgi:hypothetical protein